MSKRIEDYAVIGNCETMALVALDGSIDWLPLPRFDSPACFAALLGDKQNGHWSIAPCAADARTRRRYRGDSLILETEFETEGGRVRLIDVMSRRNGASDIVRIVEGLSGRVRMQTDLTVRFDYGAVIPWVSRQHDGRLQFIAGPDRLLLTSDVPLEGKGMSTVGVFEIGAGERRAFSLSWSLSYRDEPPPVDPETVLNDVGRFWRGWTAAFKATGPHRALVLRSLVTLKGLAHWETGGIVAAATTSLPERIGSTRNWDYRFCWLRDSTFTLYALLESGFLAEAQAWRRWLVRAAAGHPSGLQIMYGVAGAHRLPESELAWLAGYEASRPVRVGNAAADQLQLDVYGEVLDTLYVARKAGLAPSEPSWELEKALLDHLETLWQQPDNGIWEMRGGRRHFTHSKVMAWVAFDRGIRSCEEFGLDGPVERWRDARKAIHREVCERGFDRDLNTFVQYFGGSCPDASLLLMPAVGFLPADDPRIAGTVAAVERYLMRDGLVLRYETERSPDGLPPGEGVFLACSFWLADCYVLLGRLDEARALFDRLADLANDVGLLAEEYDPVARPMLGNFPQALSHLALINTARNIAGQGPAQDRSKGDERSRAG